MLQPGSYSRARRWETSGISFFAARLRGRVRGLCLCSSAGVKRISNGLRYELMRRVEDNIQSNAVAAMTAPRLPVSVIIPVRNEATNLPRCLEALSDFAEVYVIDSQSSDSTVEIARSCGARVVQFH